jgi:hypothetical protein
MINRQMLKHKVEAMSDSEVAEVLEYINIMESVNQRVNSPDPFEEAILALLLTTMRDEQAWPSHLRSQENSTNN